MGRIKNTAIKTLAKELIKEDPDRFTEDFEHNKNVLQKTENIKSKKIRNIVAGYISKEMKRIKKTGL